MMMMILSCVLNEYVMLSMNHTPENLRERSPNECFRKNVCIHIRPECCVLLYSAVLHVSLLFCYVCPS